MIELLVEVCKRRSLTVYTCKSNVMVFEREEGPVSEVIVNKRQLEHVSEFKYL